jgi:hypothetical protein
MNRKGIWCSSDVMGPVPRVIRVVVFERGTGSDGGGGSSPTDAAGRTATNANHAAPYQLMWSPGRQFGQRYIERHIHDENEVGTALNAVQLFRKKIVEMRHPMNFFAVILPVLFAWSCLNLFLCESQSRECNYIQIQSHREVCKPFAIVRRRCHTFEGHYSDDRFSETGESPEKLSSQISDVTNVSHSRRHFCRFDC